MTTAMETQRDGERRAMYIAFSVLVAGMMIVGLLTFRYTSSTQAAEDKAALLISGIESTGATAPSSKVIVKLLGDDGGAVCADPNGALSKATLLSQLSTGSGGPGSRPIIAGSRVVQGELAIIKVYCPDELADFQQFVDGLNLDDSVAGG